MSSWNWIECHWFLEETIKEIILCFIYCFTESETQWKMSPQYWITSHQEGIAEVYSSGLWIFLRRYSTSKRDLQTFFWAKNSFWKKKKIVLKHYFCFEIKRQKPFQTGLRNVKYSLESKILLIFLLFLLTQMQPLNISHGKLWHSQSSCSREFLASGLPVTLNWRWSGSEGISLTHFSSA